uniref:Uncharacterized protein n=1 Tax=Anguilla anguilla TaxID=7936 RepID=A0A0E9R5I1_ANGAN
MFIQEHGLEIFHYQGQL